MSKLHEAAPLFAGWYIRLMPGQLAAEMAGGDTCAVAGRHCTGGVASLSLIIGSQPNSPPSWDKAMMSLTVLNSRWVLQQQKPEAQLSACPGAQKVGKSCLLNFPASGPHLPSCMLFLLLLRHSLTPFLQWI